MANPSHSPPEFDALFTQFVDSDHQWGPLLFLRPRVYERLGVRRVLALAVLVGLSFGMLGTPANVRYVSWPSRTSIGNFSGKYQFR